MRAKSNQLGISNAIKYNYCKWQPNRQYFSCVCVGKKTRATFIFYFCCWKIIVFMMLTYAVFLLLNVAKNGYYFIKSNRA
jgi:hypothetical protein